MSGRAPCAIAKFSVYVSSIDWGTRL